jgi:NhaP-type Na+/H+ and K+/H+ antiporter
MPLSELLKLAALLMFGAFISPDVLSGTVQLGGYIFAGLAIFLVRSVALSLALLGADVDRREWLVAAWFGPRGFASIIYGLLILNSGISHGSYIFHLIALMVAGSILVNSTTDVLAVGWLRDMGVRPYYRLPDEPGENGSDAQHAPETTTNHPSQQ